MFAMAICSLIKFYKFDDLLIHWLFEWLYLLHQRC